MTISQSVRVCFAELLVTLRDNQQMDAEPCCESQVGSYVYPLEQLRRAIAAIRRCESISDDYLAQFSTLGGAFVHVALAYLALYIPDKPWDPAATAIITRRMNDVLNAELSQIFETRKFLEKQLRGTKPSRRLKVDSDKLSVARLKSTSTEKPTIYRPHISQVPQVHQELYHLLEITVKSARVERILTTPNPLELSTYIGSLRRILNNLKT